MQRKILEFVEFDDDVEVYVVVEESIPTFVDIDGKERGPFLRGDEIRPGQISDNALRLLLQRGWIRPKK